MFVKKLVFIEPKFERALGSPSPGWRHGLLYWCLLDGLSLSMMILFLAELFFPCLEVASLSYFTLALKHLEMYETKIPTPEKQ